MKHSNLVVARSKTDEPNHLVKVRLLTVLIVTQILYFVNTIDYKLLEVLNMKISKIEENELMQKFQLLTSNEQQSFLGYLDCLIAAQNKVCL